jgi:bifunctional DNA-binding transcriptional regulator/antitoxin component of YhaV-PrlF toxin-antitoxin module
MISPTYRVVIPCRVRERLRLKPRQRVQAIVHGDRVLISLQTARSLRGFVRGFVRGFDGQVERDTDRG